MYKTINITTENKHLQLIHLSEKKFFALRFIC